MKASRINCHIKGDGGYESRLGFHAGHAVNENSRRTHKAKASLWQRDLC